MEIPGVRFPYWPVPAKTLIAEIEKNRKEILVVDDDPVVLDLMKLYLGAKYKVIALSIEGKTDSDRCNQK